MRAVADVEVWKALFDLLTCGTDEPIVCFDRDRLSARMFGFNRAIMYEVNYPTL